MSRDVKLRDALNNYRRFVTQTRSPSGNEGCLAREMISRYHPRVLLYQFRLQKNKKKDDKNGSRSSAGPILAPSLRRVRGGGGGGGRLVHAARVALVNLVGLDQRKIRWAGYSNGRNAGDSTRVEFAVSEEENLSSRELICHAPFVLFLCVSPPTPS